MILCPLRTELHLMKDSFEESFFNTFSCHFLKSIIYCFFALFDIFKLDSLNTHCECGLFSGMVIPSSWTEIGCNACLNNFLVERGVWSIEKQGGQNLHHETFIRVLRKLIAKETDAKLSLLIWITHKVWHKTMLSMDWLFQARLKSNITFFHSSIIPLELNQHLSFNIL